MNSATGAGGVGFGGFGGARVAARAGFGIGVGAPGAGAGAGAGAGFAGTRAAGVAAAAAAAAATNVAAAAAAAAAATAATAGAGAGAGAGGAGQKEKARRNNLDIDHRNAVIAELLRTSDNGVIKKGAFTRVATMFNTNRVTISKLWKQYELQKSHGVLSPNLRSKRSGKCGRKRADLDSISAAIPEIPLKDRTTQRTFAAALGIPRSTLRSNLKRLGLRASKGGSLKPLRVGKSAAPAPTPAEVPRSQAEVPRSQDSMDAAQAAILALLPPPCPPQAPRSAAVQHGASISRTI